MLYSIKTAFKKKVKKPHQREFWSIAGFHQAAERVSKKLEENTSVTLMEFQVSGPQQ